MKKLLKVLLWILIVAVIIAATLFISAWLAGFKSVGDMVRFIIGKFSSGHILLG